MWRSCNRQFPNARRVTFVEHFSIFWKLIWRTIEDGHCWGLLNDRHLPDWGPFVYSVRFTIIRGYKMGPFANSFLSVFFQTVELPVPQIAFVIYFGILSITCLFFNRRGIAYQKVSRCSVLIISFLEWVITERFICHCVMVSSRRAWFG